MMPSSLILVALLATAGTAAISDARTGHIPNWITLPPLALAPLLHAVWGGPLAAGLSLAAALACGLVPYLMFRTGGAGGGDVKLLAALGAIGGATLGIELQLFGFVIAVIYALGRLTWRGKLLATLGNSLRLVVNPILPRRHRRPITPEMTSTIRLGVPIFAGTVLSLALRGQGLT